MGADVIDRLVSRLLSQLEISQQPPIDPQRVARALGVNHIETAAMTEDGRLEQRSGQVAIWLRSGVPPTRTRFTLAHEIGHLVLADPNRDFTAHRMWTTPDREERFCDAFAASLLLPRAWIIGEFSSKPQTLDTVREVANVTGASLSASLVRLRELLDWRQSLLYWRQTDGQWALLYCSGVPRNIHNRITSAPATREAVGEIARRRMNRPTTLPLLIGGSHHCVEAEVSTRGSAVLALVDLTDAANAAAEAPF